MRRGLRRVLACLPVTAGLACDRSASREPGSSDASPLVAEGAHARSFGDSIVAAARRTGDPGAVDSVTALAAGYLERLRLGLGSPFRLAEYAARDSRLPAAARARLVAAMLERTARGATYHIDPAALDGIGGARGPARGGARHLALIDSVFGASADPAGAELAIRLAYLIAGTEGVVSVRATEPSAHAAALLRDRALAMRDARDLAAAAEAAGTAPLALLERWRRERRLRVERPPLADPPHRAEGAALAAVAPIVARLRELHRSPPGDDGARTDRTERADAHPLLGATAAMRLAQLSSGSAPPRPPVVVPLRTYRDAILVGAPPAERARRAGLLRRANTEETFVAELALAHTTGDRSDAALAAATVAVAVALRPYAQEEPWLPGDAGPEPRAATRQLGLGGLTFDADVPAAWRAYHTRTLALALADMRRVLPMLDVRGLRVHVGRSPAGPAALAMHDPVKRTLYLPPSTAAGAIAHELAHDLDWLAIERGSYATDRAIRERQQRLAAVLGRLGTATAVSASPEQPDWPEYDRRPTEVFARSVDWFVAVALAAEGRSNGHLSSVQDELLTGHVSVPAPDPTGATGAALIELLEAMTYVPRAIHGRFLAAYGPVHPPSAYEEVRSLVEIAPAPGWLVSATPPPRARAWGGAPERAGRCDHGLDEHDRLVTPARAELLTLAAHGRARGALREWAARPPALADPPAVRATRGGPWAPSVVDSAVSRLAGEILIRHSRQRAAYRSFIAIAGAAAPRSVATPEACA